jgi:hypothetical protein
VTGPAVDTHEAQAERVADHLANHPDSTLAELTAACDLGSASKVVSAMVRLMGYGIRRGGRWVAVAGGPTRRHVRTYTLTHRPAPARQLPLPLD